MRTDIIKIIYDNSNKLSRAVIEINSHCNFKCDHCYICTKNKLSFDNFKKAVDELYDLECLFLLITGGECLLNPDFKKMYLYAKNKGFLVGINTNGYLLNQEMVDFLARNKPYLIEISLYGYDSQSYYEFTHVKDSFDKINENIDYAIKKGLNINLKTPLTKKSAKNLMKLKEYSNEKGLLYRYDYIIFPKLDSSNTCDQRLDADELIDIIKNDPPSIKYFIDKYDSIINYQENSDKVFQCSAGENAIYIDSAGYINMCLVVTNKKYNISNMKIKDAQKEFLEFKKMQFRENDKCFKCNKKSICRYCPGKFFLETKNYRTPANWYCLITSRIINYITTSYFAIEKNSSELTLTNLDSMYKILIRNLKQFIPNFKENDTDKETWTNNIKKNNYNFILIYDKGKIIGYLEYYIKNKEVYLSEIEIDDDFKSDKITFKSLLEKFVSSINHDTKIICRINENNLNSIKVFTHIGMKRSEGNYYEITYKALKEYIDMKTKF